MTEAGPEPAGALERVTGEIRRAICHEAEPGERLPPVRDIAAELGVDTSIVQSSLELLRDEGLIELGRARGNRVTRREHRT